jgi:hypothetical protein
MIHIRIGAKEDKCRSVYGVLYDEDGGPFSSDATSFWTGILDGNTNIAGHTKSEVMNSYQSRVLDVNAEYKQVCDVRLDPIGDRSYFEIARKITVFLKKGRNKSSSPEKVIAGLPKFLTTMGIMDNLCDTDDGNAPESKSAPDLRESLRTIQGSCPWAF